ncbi:MAG: FAD-binding oxidoreductase [Verrucomicrobiota bacterium]
MIRLLRRLLWLVFSLALLSVLVVVGHLLHVWWKDPAGPPAWPEAGRGDVGRFVAGKPSEVIQVAGNLVEAEAQLSALVLRAGSTGGHIAIAGRRHCMGGHTMADGAMVLDMTPLKHVKVDAANKTITVGAGAVWENILLELQKHQLAVKVMQSNNDFSIGGSLSVNCHGWQQGLPPVSSTVRSFRLVTADGKVVECRRDNENAVLFRHVLGGYGLFGIVTEATLDVVDDAYYTLKSVPVTPATYHQEFMRMTADNEVGMAYGRINVAPFGFLETGTVNVLRKTSGSGIPKLTPTGPLETLKRLVFRGSVGSAFGKQIREWGEGIGGETTGGWRSIIQSEPAAKFGSYDTGSSEILHEYFVPVAQLEAFVKAIRPLLKDKKYPVDLLNITVRDVKPDTDTALPYAREHVFGLVMLFHLELGQESDLNMQAFTQRMIDAALKVGGTYYLPYRLHASPEQFKAAYPQAAAFFAEKHRVDPKGIFTNTFHQTYDRK